jgi:hypothetical protein
MALRELISGSALLLFFCFGCNAKTSLGPSGISNRDGSVGPDAAQGRADTVASSGQEDAKPASDVGGAAEAAGDQAVNQDTADPASAQDASRSSDSCDVADAAETLATGAGFLDAGVPIVENAELKALLADKSVDEVLVRGDEIWFAYSMPCKTCPIDPMRSSTPYSHGLAVVVAGGPPRLFPGTGENTYHALNLDPQGKIYAAVSGGDVTPGIVDLDPLLTKDAKLADLSPFCSAELITFVVDRDKIFWGASGLGLYECTATSTVLHNHSNSILPADYVHGIAVDSNGDKWLGLDYASSPAGLLRTGLVKITGESWQYLPIDGIPELDPYSYVIPQCADKDGNLWLWGFRQSSQKGTDLMRHSGASWIAGGNGFVSCDSRGLAWRVLMTWKGSSTNVENEVAYFDQGKWSPIGASSLTKVLHAVDVYQGTLVLGTAAGLDFLNAP